MKPSLNVLRPLLLLAVLGSLSGCLKSLLPKGADRAVYSLPEPAKLSAQRALPGALLVETPQAMAPLNGEDIVVRHTDGEIQLLPGVRWAAPLPKLLQDLIARQIETAGGATDVSQSAQPFAMRYRLSSDLRAFEIRDTNGAFSVHSEISLRLICSYDARVLATSMPIVVDASTVPANPTAATAALRDAAGILARQVMFWLSKVDASSCSDGSD